MRALIAVIIAAATLHAQVTGTTTLHDTGAKGTVRGIYVAFPPPGDSHVKNYLITGPGAPYISGGACYPNWDSPNASNQLEHVKGVFVWDYIDDCIEDWSGGGKKVGIILPNSSYGTNNSGTPGWFTTPVNISSISQASGSHIISLVTAAPMNFFKGSVVGPPAQSIQISGTGTGLDSGGVGGVYTILTNADSTHLTAQGVASNDGASAATGKAGNPMIIDPSGTCNQGTQTQYYPVFWSQNFINAFESLLSAFSSRYATNTTVMFVQPGFGVGFENYAARKASASGSCNAILAPLGYTEPSFMAYLESMQTFSAHTFTKPVVWSLNYLDYGACTNRDGGACVPYNAYVLSLAANAAFYGLGLGSQGLQTSDLTTTHSDNNFVAAVKANPGLPIYEWQTASLSDPTCTSGCPQTGSLVPIFPYADTAWSPSLLVLEPYTNDGSCTFDPTYAGSGTNQYRNCQNAGYPAAWQSKYSEITGP